MALKPKGQIKKYTVLSPIKHDGEDYAVGKPIELTDDEAALLLEVKAIEGEKKPESVKE